MQTAEVRPEPVFAGSSDDQRIAGDVLAAMRAMGRFFAKDAAIRASLDSLGGYFAARDQSRGAAEWSTEVERVLRQNPEVFDVDELNGVLVVSTTQLGRAPSGLRPADMEHTLANRLMEPRPVRERPVTRRREEIPATIGETLIGEHGQIVTAAPSGAAAPTPPITTPEIEVVEELEDEDIEVLEPAAEIVTIELADATDEVLERSISLRLRHEVTVANFGDQWLAEDKTPRLSRGDLRRIRDYIVERNQPLADTVLVEDILGVRPGADQYELTRFALNFRLSREPREFEFVGTPGQRLWSLTSGLPAIGTTKRKPSEIGQDYRFLLDERAAELDRSESVVEHVLTFYEYQYGVLPFNSAFEGLFPAPVLPDQRAAVLAFESPQNYETFFVELRYPTGNRGGYLAGLDRFFLENLVPGALITIERGESDGRYLIEFLPVSGLDRKLLQYDEKKNRYVFRPMTFYCATQDEMLLSENRFPHLANVSPLDERTRRRPELVLATTFERIGELVGTGGARKYMALLDDLVAAANIERPMSAELVRSIVTSTRYEGFSADPDVQDVFYYEPPTE